VPNNSRVRASERALLKFYYGDKVKPSWRTLGKMRQRALRQKAPLLCEMSRLVGSGRKERGFSEGLGKRARENARTNSSDLDIRAAREKHGRFCICRRLAIFKRHRSSSINK